jgi:hypothetical protein
MRSTSGGIAAAVVSGSSTGRAEGAIRAVMGDAAESSGYHR